MPCLYCGKVTWQFKSVVRAGAGKYCERACYILSMKEAGLAPRLRPRHKTESEIRQGRERASVKGIWRGMLDRCSRRSNPRWKDYGGRGITVCSRWQESFESFVADMGSRPPAHQIDRIDNDGNYEPTNCRWVTAEVKANNTRRNKLLTAFGETKTLAEWARSIGVSPRTIGSRLRSGWSLERTLRDPISSRHSRAAKRLTTSSESIREGGDSAA